MYEPAVTVYVPAPVYGAVPPAPVAVMVVVPPGHSMLPATALARITGGGATVTDVVAVHPLLSVMI